MVQAVVRDDYGIELEGFDEFIAKLSQLDDASGDAGREIGKAMQAALDVLGDQIDARTPVNIGGLRGSRASEIHGTPLHMEGVTMTPLSYGWPVERGRKPGKMPPVDALEYWVKRKGIAFDGMSPRETAWIIARAIAKHGTKGAFMYRDGTAAARPYVEKVFEGLVDRLMKGLAS